MKRGDAGAAAPAACPSPPTADAPGALERPGVAWLLVAALLAGGALALTLALVASGALRPGSDLASAFDWQPGASWPQVWRPWSGAWVHWSWPHLAVNIAGAAVVAALGWRARAPVAAAWAWFLAWPLTQALLALPDALPPGSVVHATQRMHHYGGLSGVLHAGVVVIGLALLFPRSLGSGTPTHPGLAPLTPAQAARHRAVGLALVAGTLAKVFFESPWNLALRPSALLGIDVAPIAHACGVMAGTLAWGLVAVGWRAHRRSVYHGRLPAPSHALVQSPRHHPEENPGPRGRG